MSLFVGGGLAGAGFIAAPALAQPRVSPDIGTTRITAPIAQPEADGAGGAERTNGAGPVDEAWLERHVADLDSPDFAAREKASNELTANEHLPLKAIERRLADGSRPLSPEQRLRLGEAGLKMFAGSQRGAMGVSFSLTDGAVDGVKVGGAVDGFDSKRVLKSGDVIREMDGVPLTFGDQMRSRNLIVALIISHDPGEEVTLGVIRNGEPVVVRLKLGNYRDLRNANELDPGRMRLAWDMRCQRAATASAEQEPAEAGISEERWNQIGDPTRRATARRVAVMRQNNFFIQSSPADTQPEDAGVTLVAGGSARALLNKPEDDFSANQRMQVNLIQVQQLQQRIQYLNTVIQRDQRRLADANLPEAQRQMLRASIASYQQQIGILRAQKKQMMGLEP